WEMPEERDQKHHHKNKGINVDILEQITYAIVDEDEYEDAEEKELFGRIASFILSLEPGQLDDNQLEETIEILEILDPETYDATMMAGDINFSIVEQKDEPSEEDRERSREYYKKNKNKLVKRKYKRAKRTTPKKKLKSRVYKRKRRQKIRIQKRRLIRSAEGRKRIRMKDRLKRVHKTPTKRKKIRYNPIRKKRAKNKPTLQITKGIE
ncbi:unnamed protein product, partial [marine sediment metagenome]